jgi:excisionase family DNA binding protein
VVQEEDSMVAVPVLPGTITPDSMPPEQLEELLALFQSGEARLVGPHGEEHLVPAALYGLMRGLLDNLKRGEAVTVVPHDALLTTQQAAQILNISRPYLYRLLEQKAVPVVMVGTHRRLLIHDVLQLREERQQGRRSALDELSELGQEMQVEAV